jgi:DNA-directed RNA polymerase specialized sigma24 family protein
MIRWRLKTSCVSSSVERRAVFEEMFAEFRAAQPQAEGEYLSIKHASARLDIPEITLRNWIKRGQLKKHKIQGCVRVKLADILNLEGE